MGCFRRFQRARLSWHIAFDAEDHVMNHGRPLARIVAAGAGVLRASIIHRSGWATLFHRRDGDGSFNDGVSFALAEDYKYFTA